MKKRILSIVLTLCMVLLLVPATAFAEGGISHEGWTKLTKDILDKNYKINDIAPYCYCLPSGNYYLGDNISVGSYIDIGAENAPANVVLDLNGYELENEKSILLCTDYSSILTLTDSSSTEEAGKVISEDGIYVGPNSTLHANGGTIECSVVIYNGVIDNTDPSNVTVFTGEVSCLDKGTIKDSAKVTVTFDSDNGNTVQEEKVLRGQKVNEPTAPTKEGYEFAGWYNGDTKYDFTQNVTENITLTAHWKSVEAPVITGLENGKTYCDTVQFEVSDNVGVASVTANDVSLTPDANNKYTLEKAKGIVTVVAKDNADNDTTVIVTVNNGHTGETATYFKKAVCQYCKEEYGEFLTDTRAPSGEITVDANKWSGFLSTITFGIFFKDTQKVTITANDDSYSHDGYTDDKAVKVEYYLYSGDTALTEADLAGKEFTEYDHAFNINPDNKYVIYVKLTDHAGNVTYISSEGVVLDATAPVIKGLENGKTYCDAVEFEVSDNVGVASVTANGVTLTPDANNKYTLEKGKGTVTVVAKDNADNDTTVIVTVNNGHTWNNGVCSVCDYACKHTGGKATCISKAICEYCGEEYDEVDSSNHTGGTETRGAKSPSCTEAGYTGDTYCKGCGTRLSSGVTIIKSAHNLENIPAKDATVTETGNSEYWQCKDCKQCFSDKDGKNTIELKDTVTQKLPPEIIEGTGQSITAGEKKELTFKSNAAFSDFIRVELDGKTLDEKNYTVKEGSTVVTLKADYAATLSVGEHTIGIVSESGTATTAFTVNVKVNAWDKTVLRPQASASKTSIKIKWNAVPEADGYVIYWNPCGAKTASKQIKVIKSGKTLTWTHKGLKKGSLNKYYVKAYKMIGNKKQFIKTSKQIHLATEGGKYTNVKKLQSSISSVTLKKGKTKALTVTSIYAERNKKPVTHMRTIAYTTSNKKVASVTAKGVIKAEGKGSCYIYITASSGVYTRVKVVVK